MNYYYLDPQKREVGPITLENLKTFRSTGVISDETPVGTARGGPWSACLAILGSGVPITPSATVLENAAADARDALADLWKNPVAGLASCCERLGPKRALSAGCAFGALCTVAWIGAIYISGSFAPLRPEGGGGFLKLLFATVGSLAAWTSALGLPRHIKRTGGSWERDVFVIGVISLGWAVGACAIAVLSWKNMEVLGFIGLVIGCQTVLQLFVGLVRISGMKEQSAALMVPLVLVAGAWLTKVIFAAIY